MLLYNLFTKHIFELMLILISAYILSKANKTRNTNNGTKAFYGFATVNLIFQLSNLGMDLYREEEITAGLGFGYTVYILAILSMAAGAYFWFNYVEEVTDSKLFDTVRKKVLWAIPLFVLTALCVVSIKTGWLFFFDAGGKYDIGPLFFLQYVFIYIYILMAIIKSGTNYFRTETKNDTDRMLLTIMIIDTAAAVIQLIYPVFTIDSAFLLTLLLGYMTVYSSGMEQERLAKQKEENKRSRIIETLSEDFGCVMYIELKDDEDSDISTNYRVSGLLKRIIPRWELETGFKKKLNLLLDYVIYEPDKERVIHETRRDIILEKLKDEDVCYIDCRLVIDGEIKYYQMKYSAVRENGKLTGVVTGLHSVDESYKEQQKHLLGAVPISPDVLSKANIGLWSFELDEGQPPRMYGDEAMLRLVGLDRQVPPEEMYHAWYDHIDEGSYDLVTDAVNKMTSGEHAEVQYPWHYPDGRTIINN